MSGKEQIMVSEKEAASLIGVSKRTMFTLRQQHGVPYVQLPGRILYPVKELREWVAQQVRTNTPTPNDDED